MSKSFKTPLVPDEVILAKIYLLRGQKVMLDRDLANLYGVRPVRLREQVKRNPNRFPAKFMFQLSEEETETMVSQNAIPSRQHLGGHLPYAFTEHGVLMLANVLKTPTAVDVSVRIVELFVKMRELLLSQKDILLQLEKVEQKLVSHDDDIARIFEHLKELLEPPPAPRRQIGFRQNNEDKG